jgi:hypothetical protein
MQQMKMERSPQVQKCIEDCLTCYRVCSETTAHCLQMGGKHVEASHQTLMNDCTKACALSADYMLRNSEFDLVACSVCAQVCDSCAASCDQFDEEFMKNCAQTCRECAESCRNMAK